MEHLLEWELHEIRDFYVLLTNFQVSFTNIFPFDSHKQVLLAHFMDEKMEIQRGPS